MELQPQESLSPHLCRGTHPEGLPPRIFPTILPSYPVSLCLSATHLPPPDEEIEALDFSVGSGTSIREGLCDVRASGAHTRLSQGHKTIRLWRLSG